MSKNKEVKKLTVWVPLETWIKMRNLQTYGKVKSIRAIIIEAVEEYLKKFEKDGGQD